MSYIKIDMNGIVVKRCANLKSRFWGGVTEASARKEIEKPLKRFIPVVALFISYLLINL